MKKAFFEPKYRFIFFPLMAAAFLGLVSLAVMLLWNNLLPDILHVSTITFWQAMGIFVLSKLLFGFTKPGGGRFGGGNPWMRGGMAERFKNMTPEERIRFKEQFSDRMCGGRGRGRWGKFEWPEEETRKTDEPAD